jgi:hypothetical protein
MNLFETLVANEMLEILAVIGWEWVRTITASDRGQYNGT